MLEQLSIFQALSGKMDYLNARQRVLAQNIANADTPGYKPHDLQAPNFERVLSHTSQGVVAPTVALVATQSGHVAAPNSAGQKLMLKTSRDTYEVSPSGNAVVLEEQMMKASQSALDYQMVSQIYTKQLDMLRLATRGR